MSDLTMNKISELPQTPLVRGIKAGDIAIRRDYFAAVPVWIKEFVAEMQVPYVVTAMILIALFSFSFGIYMQEQLFNEAVFVTSYLQIDPEAASREWL